MCSFQLGLLFGWSWWRSWKTDSIWQSYFWNPPLSPIFLHNCFQLVCDTRGQSEVGTTKGICFDVSMGSSVKLLLVYWETDLDYPQIHEKLSPNSGINLQFRLWGLPSIHSRQCLIGWTGWVWRNQFPGAFLQWLNLLKRQPRAHCVPDRTLWGHSAWTDIAGVLNSQTKVPRDKSYKS